VHYNIVLLTHLLTYLQYQGHKLIIPVIKSFIANVTERNCLKPIDKIPLKLFAKQSHIILGLHKVAQKVSHYQESALNRIKNRQWR